MTSAAIPTMNNPAIPTSAARAVFFLAHANEKQGQANGKSNGCAGDERTLRIYEYTP